MPGKSQENTVWEEKTKFVEDKDGFDRSDHGMTKRFLQKPDETVEEDQKRANANKKGGEKKKSAFIIIRYKKMFSINGVLYLWKLYLFLVF